MVQGCVRDCWEPVLSGIQPCELGALLYTFQAGTFIVAQEEGFKSQERLKPCGHTHAIGVQGRVALRLELLHNQMDKARMEREASPCRLLSLLLARDSQVRLQRGGQPLSESSTLPSRLSWRRFERGGTLLRASSLLKLRSTCLRHTQDAHSLLVKACSTRCAAIWDRCQACIHALACRGGGWRGRLIYVRRERLARLLTQASLLSPR